MDTKVMIAFSNMICSEGVKNLLDGKAASGADDLFSACVLMTGAGPYDMIKAFGPDVILVDLITLYNEFGETGQAPGMRLVLLDTGCGPDVITAAVAAKGLKGVLTGNSTPLLLKEAISAVAMGGVWFSRTAPV